MGYPEHMESGAWEDAVPQGKTERAFESERPVNSMEESAKDSPGYTLALFRLRTARRGAAADQ